MIITDLYKEAQAVSLTPKGYSEDELEQIARLYNIVIEGQLKAFLAEMGRSDGGLIGDDMIHLYRPTWNVRTHLFFQFQFFNDIQDIGCFEFLNKPFVFAWISETQYYFVQTSIGDQVFHYDENTEEVHETEWDLLGFIQYLARNSQSKLRAEGDLLRI
ncbi:hypothetical protein [Algicola sagamiensis]|uniref:hypothetical protein n=1 Tax=Algicola sagamiensis TaxID=163869 RepID=UPI000369B108|nr:hypothetical protein [Algicola sagamiensis]